MRRPRDLSGSRLIDALCRNYGYQRVHQVGSHVILETEHLSIIALLSRIMSRLGLELLTLYC